MTDFAELLLADIAGVIPEHLPDIAFSLHDIHPLGSLSTAGESQHAQNILGKFDLIERSQCCFGIETSSLLVLSFLTKNIQNQVINEIFSGQQKQRIRASKPLKINCSNVFYPPLSSVIFSYLSSISIHSKSSCPQGHVGSNPTRSAMKVPKRKRFGLFPYFFSKTGFFIFFQSCPWYPELWWSGKKNCTPPPKKDPSCAKEKGDPYALYNDSGRQESQP